jgi:hypothetical protein
MAWGDPTVEKPRETRKQTQPGGRFSRSLKRFLISLSITLNIILISLLIAGYYLYKNANQGGKISNLQDIRGIEDLTLPDSVKNSDLMKKVLELQGQNIRVINELNGDGGANKR